jgi:mono/diheme cytochrome c family protein
MIRMVLLALLVPSAALAANGAAMFNQSCAACHGKDGSGSTPVGKALKVHDLRAPEVQKKSDAELAKQIRDGKGSMPAFKGKISEDDITALVAHIRELGK